MKLRLRLGKRKAKAPSSGKSGSKSPQHREPEESAAGGMPTALPQGPAESVKALDEALQLLLEDTRKGGPHRRRHSENRNFVRDALQGLREHVAGRMGREAYVKEDEELRKKYPRVKFDPPPEWADPRIAHTIADWLRGAENKHPGAAAEFISWLKKQLARPRGRPIDPSLTKIGQQVVKLRSKGYSWRKVAAQVCTQRTLEGHTCDKACEDLLRQRARQFEPSSESKTAN
jgi:hypothetical protein